MDNGFIHLLYDYFLELGMSEYAANLLNITTLFATSLLLALLMDYIIWKILRFVTINIARRSRTNFDNFLVTNRVPRGVAHLLPLVFILEMIKLIFVDYPTIGYWVLKFFQVFAVILVLRIVKRVLASIKDYLKTLPRFRDKPIDSYIQVFMIFAWAAGLLMVIALLTGSTLWKFFASFGAASAIILLIFKDTILGLVASIQVSANDMVRIGDWITFEKFGADGNVVEINLATVKVQNFDMTITTIPTYSLIADSFQNWRGMREAGGRRIKRAIILQQSSVRFLGSEEVESLKKIQLIAAYITQRSEKIDQHNKDHHADKSLPINGRNLTNLGLFRKYAETYLEQHSAINKKMTLMCRQMAPTPQGIPIEIYAFSTDKRWENYEYIMADIFDHLIAATPYFGLKIFELPSSFEPAKAQEIA
ncbi:mechanosensitive ion channel [Zeaxanthinibacter sp. PT1]|uniref:mechanosensitive ion channel family protein n=1 Tax=Zeaxanthinibacter TaxID=561554 RepID=UPI00234AD5A6|nr:mechanosensitive ion channel domain-containing protein [Zeaxanthinibacter sp. PT1]MDC6351496.1 mechanosensitive ion channel [Zeaxanthinibacter sp. PT1]